MGWNSQSPQLDIPHKKPHLFGVRQNSPLTCVAEASTLNIYACNFPASLAYIYGNDSLRYKFEKKFMSQPDSRTQSSSAHCSFHSIYFKYSMLVRLAHFIFIHFLVTCFFSSFLPELFYSYLFLFLFLFSSQHHFQTFFTWLQFHYLLHCCHHFYFHNHRSTFIFFYRPHIPLLGYFLTELFHLFIFRYQFIYFLQFFLFYFSGSFFIGCWLIFFSYIVASL